MFACGKFSQSSRICGLRCAKGGKNNIHTHADSRGYVRITGQVILVSIYNALLASELLDHDCGKQESLGEQSAVRSGRVTGLRINCWAMILTNLVSSDAPNFTRNAIPFSLARIEALGTAVIRVRFLLDKLDRYVHY